MNKFSLDVDNQPSCNILPNISNLKELPVKFTINSSYEAEFICTPKQLEEMAIGWISSTFGKISIDDIESIDVCIQKAQVNVTLKENIDLCRQSFSQSVVSALESMNIGDATVTKHKQKVDTQQVRVAAEKLNSMRSKGLHGAMLWGRKTFVYYEDISRHCAVDKAIGGGIKLGMDIQSSVLVTTGRISSELLWKAKLVELPVVASIKYPSETGILLSNAWGITIVSKVLCDDVVVY